MKIRYIINEEQVKKYTNNLEIKFINCLINNNIDEGFAIINELYELYPNNTALGIIVLLFGKLYNIICDPKVTFKRDYRRISGTFDAVFGTLLISDDYYRMSQLLGDELANLNDDEMDIKMLAYLYLTNAIISFNQKNLNSIKEKISFTIDKTNINDLLIDPNLSSINLEIAKNTEAVIKYSDEDYYANYQIAYLNHDYISAYENIKKYYKKISDNGDSFNVGPILKELDLLIKSEYDNKEYNRLFDIGYSQFERQNYIDALNNFSKLLNILENGKIYVLCAECAYYLKHFDEAASLYMVADDYLNKEELEHLMETLYEVEDYEDIISYFNIYEEEYETDNPKYTYMCSVACLKLGIYDEAIEFLELSEMIYDVYYDYKISYDNEKEIINKLIENDENEIYLMDDYIDFTLSKDENLLKEYASELKNYDLDEYDYNQLFSLIKIFISLNNYSEAKKILDHVKRRLEVDKNSKYQKTYKKFSSFYEANVL